MILTICILGWLFLNTWVGLICITSRTFIEIDDLWAVVLSAIFSFPVVWGISIVLRKIEDCRIKRKIMKK